MKSKFGLWQHIIITYWLKKRIKKLTFLKDSCFWKRTVTVNLNKFSSNAIFRWYNFGNFSLSNSTIFVEDIITLKRDFEIFLIDHYAGDVENKNIAGKY